jgi:lycopene cyclase domain-containing protein
MGPTVSYTLLVAVGVGLAVLIDLVVLRTRLLRRRSFWVAYAIVLFFQLITNGLLAGLPVVRYDPAAIIGVRIAYAPVEDLFFGFAMVTVTLSVWVRLTRGAPTTRPADPAAPPTRDAPARRTRGR